jgi:hypothetical protein
LAIREDPFLELLSGEIHVRDVERVMERET